MLQQVVTGYLCGSNNGHCSKHVFNYNTIAAPKNILTYFYRFDYQGRGTVHFHLLVWLKHVERIQHHLLRADCPDDTSHLKYYVKKYQYSSHTSIPVSQQDTHFVDTPTGKQMTIYHPREAFVTGLRGYIATLLPMLKCRMDVQISDGKQMLLRYVTPYVSKWQDSFTTTGMYNTCLTPCQAAMTHLKDLHPCEPEMWMTFPSIKPSCSSSNTKKYTPPTSLTVENDTTARKYRQRPQNLGHMSFFQWLRAVIHQAPRPKLYMHQHTLVGIKYLSLSKEEYFFQYVLMNHLHRDLNELKPLLNHSAPVHLLYFKAATEKFPDIWTSAIHIRQMLERDGHREHYILTVTASVNSLLDALHMCAHGVLHRTQFVSSKQTTNRQYTLEVVQERIVHVLEFCLDQRCPYYDAMNAAVHTFGETDSDDDLPADINMNDDILEHMDVQ